MSFFYCSLDMIVTRQLAVVGVSVVVCLHSPLFVLIVYVNLTLVATVLSSRYESDSMLAYRNRLARILQRAFLWRLFTLSIAVKVYLVARQ